MNADRAPRPYLNPYAAGALLGVVLFLAFFATGNGLGASGGMARILLSVEDRIAPEHVDRTAHLLNLAGPRRDPLDNWVVLVTIGALAGGFVSGWRHRRLKLETVRGPRVSVPLRWATALAGGTLMGFGARLARGCTSGQALSGGAVLSLGSWAFMFSVFAGGYALAWFFRRLWT